MSGKIIEKDTMILRKFIGEAEDEGKKYEICVNMNGSPLIESKQTGKYYSLGWEDILKMAVEAGIDEPREEDANE